MKPCKHFPSRDGCRVCWLYEHDARYRTFWGGDPDTTTTEIVTTGATPPPNRGAQPTDEQMAMLRKIKLQDGFHRFFEFETVRVDFVLFELQSY